MRLPKFLTLIAALLVFEACAAAGSAESRHLSVNMDVPVCFLGTINDDPTGPAPAILDDGGLALGPPNTEAPALAFWPATVSGLGDPTEVKGFGHRSLAPTSSYNSIGNGLYSGDAQNS